MSAGAKVLVLGAGQMGCALARDLLSSKEVSRIGVVDIDTAKLDAVTRVSPNRVETHNQSVEDVEAVANLMSNYDIVCSALLHRHSMAGIEAAISAGKSLVDLVGSQVTQKLALDESARERGITIIPGAGVAPGLSNVLVARGVRVLDEAVSGTIYVGGIPRNPKPPLGYNVVFALESVLNACVTSAQVLRDGEVRYADALSDVELVEFCDPPGVLEAFITEGLSTLIHTMPRRGLRSLEEKTLRYPGYVEKIEFLRDCGLFDADSVEVDGCRVVPRKVLAACLSPRLNQPDEQDITLMRVVVRGRRNAKNATYTCDMLDFYDVAAKMSSMARTTCFPCRII